MSRSIGRPLRQSNCEPHNGVAWHGHIAIANQADIPHHQHHHQQQQHHHGAANNEEGGLRQQHLSHQYLPRLVDRLASGCLNRCWRMLHLGRCVLSVSMMLLLSALTPLLVCVARLYVISRGQVRAFGSWFGSQFFDSLSGRVSVGQEPVIN
jgi:hypothetical protein